MPRKNAVNEGLPELLFQKILETNKDCNYHKHFDLHLTKASFKEVEMVVKIQDFHINPRNISHGAVAFALLDTAMGMAIRTLNRNVVTLNSNINYIAVSALGDTLRAEAQVVDYGKKIIICDSQAYNQDGQLIAIARGTFYDKGIFCEEADDI